MGRRVSRRMRSGMSNFRQGLSGKEGIPGLFHPRRCAGRWRLDIGLFFTNACGCDVSARTALALDCDQAAFRIISSRLLLQPFVACISELVQSVAQITSALLSERKLCCSTQRDGRLMLLQLTRGGHEAATPGGLAGVGDLRCSWSSFCPTMASWFGARLRACASHVCGHCRCTP